MTEKTAAHSTEAVMAPLASPSGTESIQPTPDPREESAPDGQPDDRTAQPKAKSQVGGLEICLCLYA